MTRLIGLLCREQSFVSGNQRLDHFRRELASLQKRRCRIERRMLEARRSLTVCRNCSQRITPPLQAEKPHHRRTHMQAHRFELAVEQMDKLDARATFGRREQTHKPALPDRGPAGFGKALVVVQSS